MLSVAPNIVFAPNITQNAERKQRTQNTNTAHFRTPHTPYRKSTHFWLVRIEFYYGFVPTAREGNVYTRVCDSGHNQPHGASVTAHPCWLLGHSLLWRGRYASYWNAFFFLYIFN